MNDAMEGFYQPTEGPLGSRRYRRVISSIFDMKSSIGIACLSESNRSELMWAHYADNYAGLCVEYDTQRLVAALANDVKIVRLSYGDAPPKITENDTQNLRSAAIKILSHKKDNWAYEREWRILGRPAENYHRDERCITGIYFGSRIRPQHKQRLMDAFGDSDVKLFDMSVNGYEHKFDPVDRLEDAL
jgi:hypothetical protein